MLRWSKELIDWLSMKNNRKKKSGEKCFFCWKGRHFTITPHTQFNCLNEWMELVAKEKQNLN